MKGKKIYHSFKDLKGNLYEFNNYMDFAKWWFGIPFNYRNSLFSFELRKKLQYAASESKEARTKMYS